MKEWLFKLFTKCICWGYVEYTFRELDSIEKSELPPSMKKFLKDLTLLTIVSLPIYLISRGKWHLVENKKGKND